jgi:hypothetical protein
MLGETSLLRGFIWLARELYGCYIGWNINVILGEELLKFWLEAGENTGCGVLHD